MSELDDIRTRLTDIRDRQRRALGQRGKVTRIESPGIVLCMPAVGCLIFLCF